MKTYKKLFILCLVFGAFLTFFSNVHAATPVLSLSSTGGGTDNVTINVTGDINSNVVVYYTTGSIVQSRVIGNISNNGFFSATISSGSFGITPGSLVYVIVNYQQSLPIAWPFYSTSPSSSSITLSQTNLSLSVGQTSIVTVSSNYNNYYSYGSFYISNNSNSSVTTASIINNTVSIYANGVGNSTITICQNGNVSFCGTVYVSVVATGYRGYGYNPVSTLNTLGLNISSLTLTARSSMTITSADPGGMYVSNNTNPKIVSTSYSSSSFIPGCTAGALFSVLTGQSCLSYNNQTNTNNNTSVVISALAVGSDTITLCQNSGNACSNIYVSVIY